MERRLQINSKRVGTWKRARWYFGPHHLIDWIRNYTIRPFSPALICTSSILCRFNNFFCTSFFFTISQSLHLSHFLFNNLLLFFFFFPLILSSAQPRSLYSHPFFLLSEIGNRAAGNWRSLSLSGPSGFAMLFHHSSSVWVFSARWPILASPFCLLFSHKLCEPFRNWIFI